MYTMIGLIAGAVVLWWLVVKCDIFITTVYRNGRWVDLNSYTGKIVNDPSEFQPGAGQ